MLVGLRADAIDNACLKQLTNRFIPMKFQPVVLRGPGVVVHLVTVQRVADNDFFKVGFQQDFAVGECVPYGFR